MAGVYLAQQPPRIFAYTIDTIIGESRFDEIRRVVLLYLAILVAGQLIGAVSRFWITVAGQRLLHRMRLQLFDHIQTQALVFFDNRRVGDLMARITDDVRQVEHLILHFGDRFTGHVFGMGFALYYMIRFSPLLTLSILVPVPFLAVATVLFSRRMRSRYRAIRDAMGALGAKLHS